MSHRSKVYTALESNMLAKHLATERTPQPFFPVIFLYSWNKERNEEEKRERTEGRREEEGGSLLAFEDSP